MGSEIEKEEFENLLRFKMSLNNQSLVMRAYHMNKYGQKDRRRQNKEKSFENPKEVALILMREFGICDHEVIIAGLLYDSVEDSFIFSEPEKKAFEEIKREFGERSAQFVKLLTKMPCEESGKAQRDCAYFNDLFDGPVEAKIIKIADRIHNLRELKYCDAQKQDKQLLETSMCVWRIAESIRQERPDIFEVFKKAYREAMENFNGLISGRALKDV